jgi:hypothetical protein
MAEQNPGKSYVMVEHDERLIAALADGRLMERGTNQKVSTPATTYYSAVRSEIEGKKVIITQEEALKMVGSSAIRSC